MFYLQSKKQTEEIKMNAATAATQTVANLVAKGMTPEAAAAHLVERMMNERPELAAKVFLGLVAA